jgi:O-antigen/teichoic acid export membrane protein
MTKLFNTYFQEIKNVASKGLFHMFTANGLIFIVAFASQLFVAGILEPDDIGRIKIMQTYIGLASLIGGFGFNTSLLKLVASTNSDLEKAQYFNLGLLVSVVSFFILYGLLYLLNDFGMISDDNIITQLFPFYAFSLLPGILQSMYLSYYQAIKEIKKMAVIQLFVKVVSVIVIIVVTYYYGIKGYLIFIPISGILAVVILEGGLKPSLLKRVSSGIDWKHLPIMWSLASFALLANFFGTISMTMDVYLINYLVEDKT